MTTTPTSVPLAGAGLPRLRARLLVYAELGRISNLPTTLSNVLVGAAAAAAGAALPWPAVGLAMAAVVLLYVGGMALNDVVDAEHDRVSRPERPIPSGRVSLAKARAFVAVCFAAALVLLLPLGLAALAAGAALLVTIAAYDWLHKKTAVSVLLMGLCRGLVYVLAAAAVSWPFDLWLVGGLALVVTLYTIGLTAVARSETAQQLGKRRWVALVMPLVVIVSLGLRPDRWPPAALAGVVLAFWLSRAAKALFANPPRTIAAILVWIAGISFLDAFLLTLLDRPGLALAAAGCGAFTAWGHRRILGT